MEGSSNDTSNPLVICVQKTSMVAPIAISVFAVFLSLLNFLYTKKKDSKSRVQSIEDDFWLRKVAAPSVIEPTISLVSEMAAELPGDCSNPNLAPTADLNIYKNFIHSYQPKIKKLDEASKLLMVIDRGLRDSFQEFFEKIEDGMLDYCAKNGTSALDARGRPLMTRENFISHITDLLIPIMQKIKLFQQNSGN